MKPNVMFEVYTGKKPLPELRAGDIVKVATLTHPSERFWCEVIELIEEKDFKCRVDNDLGLFDIHGIKCDDELVLPRDFVLEVFAEENYPPSQMPPGNIIRSVPSRRKV